MILQPASLPSPLGTYLGKSMVTYYRIRYEGRNEVGSESLFSYPKANDEMNYESYFSDFVDKTEKTLIAWEEDFSLTI